MPVLNVNALIVERVTALHVTSVCGNLPRFALGLSGGIDSAVMACLAVLTVGKQNVILVHSNISSNPTQTARAVKLAVALGVPLHNIDLSRLYEDLIVNIDSVIGASAPTEYDDMVTRSTNDPTIFGSIRSTLRAPVLRAFNRLLGGGLVLGTGNEDEDRALRFYQKGGDGEVDCNPIAFLSKGEVYQLALGLGKYLDLHLDNDIGPTAVQDALLPIIQALPSPDLWGTGDAHSDEAELKKWLGVDFTYSRIDPATGQYTKVGTIERVNRLLDLKGRAYKTTFGDALFSLNAVNWEGAVTEAKRSGYFKGLPNDTIEALLKATRRAEAATRHKMNPNCPTYGSRAELVEAGILTDVLPDIDGE